MDTSHSHLIISPLGAVSEYMHPCLSLEMNHALKAGIFSYPCRYLFLSKGHGTWQTTEQLCLLNE